MQDLRLLTNQKPRFRPDSEHGSNLKLSNALPSDAPAIIRSGSSDALAGIRSGSSDAPDGIGSGPIDTPAG